MLHRHQYSQKLYWSHIVCKTLHLSHVPKTMHHHESLTPRNCPNKTTIHSSYFRNCQFVNAEIPLFLWSVSHVFTSASWSGSFARSLQKEFMLLWLLLSCLHHSRICSHLKVDKYAFYYTMLFAYFITFNLKCMVYKILICALHISRTNLFSVYSLSVSATEQLVQGKTQLSVSLQRWILL